MKRNIYLNQFNQAYDNDIYLPMSIGMLAAYARSDEAFAAAYEVRDLVFERAKPESVVAGYDAPAILGYSCYVWNTQLSLAVAKLAKEAFPSALVVFGGPSVPNAGEAFLRRYPFIDVLVHGEGEVTFREVCLAHLGGDGLRDVNGISFRPGGRYVKTAERRRARNLDEFPSPFLKGVFDPLMTKPYNFQAIWETNRGCPFECAFCYWGSNLKAKISKYGSDRLERELDWMVRRKIEFIYAADANFGIDKRDYTIAESLVRRKEQFGYPKSFFINYLKNSNDKVFEIAKLLHRAGMCKGATLSLQSTSESVLANVKRDNIKMPVFRALQKRYREEGIPSYTELILGLAGETLESFKGGIEETIAAGEHDQVYIYLCRLLPNTDMADAGHVQEHGIITRSIPIQANHADLADDDPVAEHEEIVVGTAAMPPAQWVEANKISWMIQVFFCLKLMYFITLFLHGRFGVPVTGFCQFVIDHISDQRLAGLRVLRGEFDRLERYLDSLVAGRPTVDMTGVEGFLRIRWPIEEVSFLRLALDIDVFYAEVKVVVEYFLEISGIACESALVDEVIRYQRARVMHFAPPPAREMVFSYNLPEFFDVAMRCESTVLTRQPMVMTVHDDATYETPNDFARYHLWYGRRGKSFCRRATYRSLEDRAPERPA